MTATVQTKSQLAKLLATENISFQHNPSAKTACFDIKSRMLTLPVWRNISNDLYDMLVVHEVGHALDTPAEGWLNGITDIVRRVYGKDNPAAERSVKDFMNVIEDARIDKRQKRRYPGSRRNYIVGYKELVERDFFGTSKLDINTLNFIDRANIYFKGGFNLGIRFNDEERAFIKRMENAETFKEVLELTEEIFRRAKELGQMEQRTVEQEIFADIGDEDEDGDEYEYVDSDDGDEYEDDGEVRRGDLNRKGEDKKSEDQEDGDDASDNAQSKRGERGEGDIDENSNTGSNKPSNGAGSSNTPDDDYVPESLTERTWQEKQDNIVVNENIDYIYLNLPKFNIKNIVDDYKTVINNMHTSILNRYGQDWFNVSVTDFNDFKKQENNTISFMVKEFEMRKQADTYARISIAKTGVIDTNKLHSYKYNDDIFRRLATVPNGKNHGFVMFLDWSGSMHTNIRQTVKQLISLTLFCKRVQVPFEVYAFRDLCNLSDYKGDQFDSKEYSIKFEDFKLRNVLSSRMNLTELNKAFACLWCASARIDSDTMGGTPLNQAIIAAEQLVNDFRKRNKLQIVNTVFLTDGDSNCIGGYVGRSSREYYYKGRQYFIQDEVTKREYALGMDYHNVEVTKTFLSILKDRTQCNLIGIYLSEDRIPYTLNKFFSHVSNREPLIKFWKDNKFLPVNSAGYDEYYIVDARSMKIDNTEMSINSNMSKTNIAKEFLKFSEKKTINRVLLGRLIDHVTSNAKVKSLKMA